MNLNLTENQKRILTGAATALMMLLALFLGYNVTPVPPTQVVIVTPEPQIGVQAVERIGIRCGSDTDPCVDSRFGRDINVYSDDGSTSKFSLDGATGNVIAAGSMNANSLTLSTPLAAAQFVAPTSMVRYGATPAAALEICKTVNVIGAATVTFPGISTPLAVTHGVGEDPGGNVDIVSHTNSAGVVTLKTWRIVLNTPAAATTVVAVDVCAKGN